MKGKIGLFFGTFNPIHIGHLALAEFLYRYTELDQICFVVTPYNPFKKKSNLLPDRERLHLVHLALEDQEGMTVRGESAAGERGEGNEGCGRGTGEVHRGRPQDGRE